MLRDLWIFYAHIATSHTLVILSLSRPEAAVRPAKEGREGGGWEGASTVSCFIFKTASSAASQTSLAAAITTHSSGPVAVVAVVVVTQYSAVLKLRTVWGQIRLLGR